MAKNNNLTDFLTDVADAIRTKKGTTGTINPQNFSSEIASISTGTDTSDGNIEPTTVLKGYKGYAKGAAVNGTIETYDGTVEDVVTDVTVPVGFLSNFILNDVPTTALPKTDIALMLELRAYGSYAQSIECINTDNGFQIKYTIGGTETIVYQNGWADDNYRYVQVGSLNGGAYNEITIPAVLWNWLQTNATRPADTYTEVEVERSGNYSVINNADTSKIYIIGILNVAGNYAIAASILYNGNSWTSSSGSGITIISSSTPSTIYFYGSSGSTLKWNYCRAIVGNTAGDRHQLGVVANTWINKNGAFYICLTQGTPITLANCTKKPIEDITYDDDLLVWNFYEGKFDTAKPTWIKIEQVAPEYNLCKFSNGAEVGFVGEGGDVGYHRIYNDEAKCFTHTGVPETPIGTTTFAEDLSTPTLVEQRVVKEPVKFYNIITDKHYNLFANGILTSCKLSNKYAIEDMRYVGEQLISDEEERAYFERIENIKA